MKSNFSCPFYFPLLSEARKGMGERGTRYQIYVIVADLFIQNLKVLIIYPWFPDQVILKQPYFSTSDQPTKCA